jgi:hypothetical protein
MNIMPKPRYVNILHYKSSRVISVVDHNGEEYRMDFWALRKLLEDLIDTEWFKDKKPKWKYKRLDYEETYKHLAYHPALHKLINMEDGIL